MKLLPEQTGKALVMVEEEIKLHRLAFPGNEHLLAALVTKVGTLANTLLMGKAAVWRIEQEIEQEACHVACVAVRIMTEGDADFERRT